MLSNIKEGRKSSRGIFDDGSFRVRTTQSSATKYDIYLFGTIEDTTQFVDAIEVLDSANEGDLVIVHLSTFGGSCDATDTFIHALRMCRGRVIVNATGGVCSAGTIILLACEEFTLSEGFYAMCHNGSFGAGGKTSDVKSQVAFEAKFMDDLMRRTYEGFLTDEEIEQMIAGKDFWMDAPEWMERWNKREALLGNQGGEENSMGSLDSDE